MRFETADDPLCEGEQASWGRAAEKAAVLIDSTRRMTPLLVVWEAHVVRRL